MELKVPHHKQQISYDTTVEAVMTVWMTHLRGINPNRREVARDSTALEGKGYTPLPAFDPAAYYAQMAAQGAAPGAAPGFSPR